MTCVDLQTSAQAIKLEKIIINWSLQNAHANQFCYSNETIYVIDDLNFIHDRKKCIVWFETEFLINFWKLMTCLSNRIAAVLFVNDQA